MSVGLESKMSKITRSDAESRGQSSIQSGLTSTTKITSQESLMFGSEEGFESRTQMSKETRQLLSALELAVIFEDCVDTLTALSNAVAAPSLEIRTASSILEDEFFNRPRYGGRLQTIMKSTPPSQPLTKFADAVLRPLLPSIPLAAANGASQKHPSAKSGQKKSQSSVAQTATSSSCNSMKKELEKQLKSEVQGQGSSSEPTSSASTQERERDGASAVTTKSSTRDKAGKEEEVDAGKDAENIWLLKQYYQPKLYKRTWQANKETAKRTFDEMVKSAGLKKSNPHHKMQADIGAIKMMMADIFDELVQRGTHDCLERHLTNEREELNKLSEAAKRLQAMRKYSRKLKAEINETRQAKKTELQMLKLIEHQIEDEGQEIRVRTAVEAVYTQSYVLAKIQQSLKVSVKPPEQCEREIARLHIWFIMEDTAHWAMKEFLLKRLNQTTELLEYWVEKYETDKERLTTDLDELKEEREAKAQHRRELEAKIRMWMPIIKDDRRIRKLEKKRADFFKYCSYLATKVAARWRGYMVRAGLGKFKQYMPKQLV